MNIKDILESHLIKEQEKNNSRERSGLWNPSSFGRCFRFQYWNRLNEPASNPIDIDTLKRFRRGSIVHKDLLSLLPIKENIEHELTINDCHGFIDYWEDDTIYDIKTCNSFVFKHKKEPGFKPEIDDSQYLYQLMAYVYLMNKRYGMLVYVNEDYDFLEFPFDINHWKLKIEDELTTLRNFWEIKETPDPFPRAYNRKECNYCKFFDKCKSVCIEQGIDHPSDGKKAVSRRGK